MRTIQIEDAYRQSCKAEVLNARKQRWTEQESFNCIGNPKKQHILLVLLDCEAVYTLKDGRELRVPRNSVVYAPEGCEYSVVFTDCNTDKGYNTIGINFKLYDENDVPFRLSDDVRVYALRHTAPVLDSFHKIADEFQYAIRSSMKINGMFYLLLSDIGGYYHERHNILPKYNVISKGISALESSRVNEITVNELAKMCNVSPIYFRKLFKEYSGVTPIEYKLNVMIEEAKQQLIYSDKPVWEIAEALGFSSATYFCRAFRKRVGMTPVQYKESQE